jgi:hypothetical protein
MMDFAHPSYGMVLVVATSQGRMLLCTSVAHPHTTPSDRPESGSWRVTGVLPGTSDGLKMHQLRCAWHSSSDPRMSSEWP